VNVSEEDGVSSFARNRWRRRRHPAKRDVSVYCNRKPMLGWLWASTTVRKREGRWAPAGLDLGGFGFRLG
jgi:hypothetical protein